MKRKRHSDEQIAFAPRQAENGTLGGGGLPQVGCISEAMFYRWKKQFAGTGGGGDPTARVAPFRRWREDWRSMFGEIPVDGGQVEYQVTQIVR
jgi:hypothetical protein